MAYNKSDAVIVICDNRTTAMTGMQDHPATGYTLQGEKTKELDFTELAMALGIGSVRTVNPYDIKQTRKIMREELARPGASVVISQGACVLLRRHMEDVSKAFKVDKDKCIGCKACIGLGCPAVSWIKFKDLPEHRARKKRKKQEGVALIDTDLCSGCTLCEQVCSVGAVIEVT